MMPSSMDHSQALGRASGAETGRSVTWPMAALAILVVFVLALISRIGMLDHAPIYDELYQLLPSISWHRDGTFTVLDGVYNRSSLFSRLVAWSFGDATEYAVADARLIPTVLPGALLVALIFAWALRLCGPVAAGVAAVLLILWPNGIEVSQYIRFYALQGLLFVAAILLVFWAITAQITWALRLGATAIALILLYFAVQLQVLTILTLSGLGLWVALFHAPRWLREEPRLWWFLGAMILAVAAVLVSGVAADKIIWAWTTYHWEPWPPQDDTTFYHRDFRDNYPTFWPLFPVIALIALRANFQVAAFCVTLFGTAFVLQSFGGLKNIRYLYSTMPFFFVLCGIAMQAIFPAIWSTLQEAARRALPEATPPRLQAGLAAGLVIVAFAFLAASNAAVPRSLKLILGSDGNQLLGKTRWHWAEADAMMAPWIEKRALIVTTEEMQAVQHLGDYDLGYNKPRFSELLYSIGPDTQPFHPDFRSGRPLIGELSDLKHVVECHPIGIVVMNAPGIRSGNMMDLIAHAKAADMAVTLDQQSGMSLLGWEHGAATTVPAACDTVPAFGPERAADRIAGSQSQPQPILSAATAR